MYKIFLFTEQLLSDMIRETSYTVGRATNCDICLTTSEMNRKWLNVISKTHFRVYRERIRNTNETVVYLEDTSSNGTYVDKNLVGCKKRVIIENNSEIALARSSFSGIRILY